MILRCTKHWEPLSFKFYAKFFSQCKKSRVQVSLENIPFSHKGERFMRSETRVSFFLKKNKEHNSQVHKPLLTFLALLLKDKLMI